jgi:hypothetical protein
VVGFPGSSSAARPAPNNREAQTPVSDDNTATVVRVEITKVGILMRIWIEDDVGRVVGTALLELNPDLLRQQLREWDDQAARDAQLSLDYGH